MSLAEYVCVCKKKYTFSINSHFIELNDKNTLFLSHRCLTIGGCLTTVSVHSYSSIYRPTPPNIRRHRSASEVELRFQLNITKVPEQLLRDYDTGKLLSRSCDHAT